VQPPQYAPASASGDLNSLVTLTFDLGTGVQCHPWHGQPSCQFWCLCDFSLSSYGQTRVKQTWCYDADLRPLRYRCTGQWCRSSYLIKVPRCKFVSLPLGRHGALSVSALLGLENLTFDLQMGSQVTHIMGFPSWQFSACYALPFLT